MTAVPKTVPCAKCGTTLPLYLHRSDDRVPRRSTAGCWRCERIWRRPSYTCSRGHLSSPGDREGLTRTVSVTDPDSGASVDTARWFPICTVGDCGRFLRAWRRLGLRVSEEGAGPTSTKIAIKMRLLEAGTWQHEALRLYRLELARQQREEQDLERRRAAIAKAAAAESLGPQVLSARRVCERSDDVGELEAAVAFLSSVGAWENRHYVDKGRYRSRRIRRGQARPA